MAAPQIDLKQLAGMIDLDSPPENIHEAAHRTARNGRFMGLPGNEQFQVIDGMLIVPGLSLPAGTNKTIGCLYDQKKSRIFFFNFNSNNNHAIYILFTRTQTYSTLLLIGPNTNGDILNFSLSRRIEDIGIQYGDPVDGDILLFLDSLGRPTKINIDRYLSLPANYIPVKRSFLKVAKTPPDMPIRSTYENDVNVTANNLTNRLFKFAYAWQYDDNEWSVLSSYSKTVLPTIEFTNVSNTDKTKNCRISLYVRTGDVNVKKIRIFVKEVLNGATSDWMLVDTIDKSSLGITSNGIYRYLFYNDGNYTPVDTNYQNQPFDYVPLAAGAFSIPNGDVNDYANITEGYNWFKSNFGTTVSTTPPIGAPFILDGFLFFADYNGTFTAGQPNIEVFVTGAGINDGLGNPVSLTNVPNQYFLVAKSSGTSINFTSTTGGATNITTILNQLKTDAVAAGWTFVSQGTNSIVIYYPTGTVVLGATRISGVPFTPNYATLVHEPEAAYSYGVVYYDENGITLPGVITDVSANITTQTYNFGALGSPSFVILNLSGIVPPTQAVSWAPVRTNELTYVKHTYWVSNQAFSNVGTLVVNQYAYVAITNMVAYNANIQATSGVVSYDFAQGDRIRFLGRYNVAGIFAAVNHEYPILGVESAPVINGVPQIGTFIKIAYPAADVAGDPLFKFDGTDDYQMYLFLIFSASKSSTAPVENTGTEAALGNVYYEIGERFPVGNPGLPTAFHFANLADNQFCTAEGDIFYRQRVVPAGQVKYIIVSRFDFGNRYATPLIQITPMVNSQYTIGPQNNLSADPFVFTTYPKFSDSGGLHQNTGTKTQQVRYKGTLQVSSDHPTWMDIYVKIDNPDGVTGTPVTILKKSDPISVVGTADPTTIVFEGQFGVPPGAKAWLIFGNGDQAVNMHPQGFQLEIDIIQNITIPIFESSYSDIYSLVTNSDGKTHVADPTAKQTVFDTMHRWSQPRQLGTAINDSNRFYTQDFDELPKGDGAIQKTSITGKLMYLFFERKCGTVGVFQKYIRNNAGQNELIVNDTIFEKQNVNYEIYEGGISNQKGSLVVSEYAHYFVDPVKSYILRWSNDGIQVLSLLYRAQAWAGANLQQYLDTHTYQFGGNAKVLGTFRNFPDKAGEYILLAQGGVGANTTLPGECLRFDESKNAFTSFDDINCDDMVCAENQMFYFYGGQPWMQTQAATPANFFGVQKIPQILLIFNKDAALKKTFQTGSYQASDYWTADNVGDVLTSQPNQFTGLPQISNIVAPQDFNIFEGIYNFAFQRDANSMANGSLAVTQGDYLKGVWISVLFRYNGTKKNYLYAPYVKFTPSPKLF